MTKKDFIDINLLSKEDIKTIVDLSHLIKRRKTDVSRPLDNKTLISIFEKTSTRTRVSFEVGIQQLGGHNVIITNNDSQICKGETVEDTAKVLSRFGDIIMARVNSHSTITTLAENASVPIINGLSDYSHPCQIIADIMTYEENLGSIKGTKIAWIGDGNNVCHSWIHAAEKLDFTLHIACPPEFMPCEKTVQEAQGNGANIIVSHDAHAMASDADAIIADTWVSMGDKDVEHRLTVLKPYQVNAELMAKAKSKAIFMHCLPAYRENEVTAEVIDGPQSVVFDEAENRLHAQKAIMLWCMDAKDKI